LLVLLGIASGCGELLGVGDFVDGSERPAPDDIDSAAGQGGTAGAGGSGTAGAPELAWAKAFGSGETDRGQRIGLTDDGTIVVAGIIGGRVDFGGGPVGNAGTQQLFVTRLDPAGEHVSSVASNGTASLELGGVGVDAAGTTVLAASFSKGSVSLAPEGDVHSADPDGLEDIMVAKLTADGTVVWSRSFSAPGVQRLTALATSGGDGGIVVVGSLRGSLVLGGTTLIAEGGDDVLVARLRSDGTPDWAARYGDGGSQVATAVTVDDAGAIWVAGTFSGSLDFGVSKLESASNADLFLAKLSPDGTPELAARHGEGGAHQVGALAASADGPVMVGSFAGITSFGGNPLDSARSPDDGAHDIFVVAFDGQGAPRWNRAIGGSGHDVGLGVAAGDDGRVLVSGSFSGSVNIDGLVHNSAGAGDAIVVELGASGEVRWSESFGRNDADAAFATAFDAGGAALCAGAFNDAFELGGAVYRATGRDDIFIALLGR
jgi:hypothetical protein